MHDQAVGNNAYMAYIFDFFDLAVQARFVQVRKGSKEDAAEHVIEKGVRVTRGFSEHEKGTAVEALVGAVSADCEKPGLVRDFARRLFVCWPEDEDDDFVIEKKKREMMKARAASQ